MQSQKSDIEKSLETILKDEPIASDITLIELLPETMFANKSEEIKRNISDFIQHCLVNKKLVKEMIERGVKNNTFSSPYQKNLALFSVQVLSGDYGDSYKLFIQGEEEMKSIRRSRSVKHQSEIEQQIQAEAESAEDKLNQKYSNFEYLLEYIRRPIEQQSQICFNYFNKIMINIVGNRAEDVYAYFHNQLNQKETMKSEDKSKNMKSDLQYLIQKAYSFGGVAEMLGKLVAEEGPVNKYVNVKKFIIQQMIQALKSEQYLKSSPNNYQYLLDFVNYVLSRTKYKSEDLTEQIAVVSQRFIDEDILWYFKQKAVKSIVDSNSLLSNGFMNSSGTLNRSESSKGIKKQVQLKPQNEQEFQNLQFIFENSIKYLRIIVERVNSQQEVDPYQNESDKLPEPTMNFQVDEVLFGQNSLYELLTLSIPYKYKNINKMWFYQLLLKITRNSRYKKADPVKQIGLPASSVIPILIHLLKTFRREYKNNGLVNFYVEELMCQAILPKIQKLDNKQAMMVLSALNPSEQVLKKYDDTRTFLHKILLIMQNKCDWFEEHFSKLGINLIQIKENYKAKLGTGSNAQNNRKNKVKQFEFLFQNDLPDQIKNNKRRQKSDRFEDNDSSEEQQQFKEFNPRREFSYPEKIQKAVKVQKVIEVMQSDDAELQQNLFKDDNNQIAQEIKVSELGTTKGQIIVQPRKQSQIELYVDSAGSDNEQENQVIREDMKPENENAK